jgi:hypothetical protein
MSEEHSTDSNPNGERNGGGDDKRNSRDMISSIDGHLESLSNTYNSASNESDKHNRKSLRVNRRTLWAVIAYAALTAGILIINLFQLNASRQAVTAASGSVQAVRDQTTRTFPPRILITGVAIWPRSAADEKSRTKRSEEIPILEKHEPLSAEVWLVNTGREIATVKERVCRWYWRTGPLPMVRPLDPTADSPCGEMALHTTEKDDPGTSTIRGQDIIMQPGDIYSWRFEIPSRSVESEELYILGYIVYRDHLGTRLATQFARRYDRNKGQFVAVKHYPQYEGEE